MDKIIRKFSQISSIAYWLNKFNHIHVTTIFDTNDDLFSIEIKNNDGIIYEKTVESLSKKSDDRVDYEFQQVINNLLLHKKLLENEQEVKESY